MEEGLPKHESELWNYLSSGNGKHCPLFNRCDVKKSHGWCFDDYFKIYDQLIDSDCFSPKDFNSIHDGGCSGFTTVINTLTERLRSKGNVTGPPVPEGLAYLADETRLIEVRKVPLKVHHGALWNLEDKWVIQIRSSDSPGRQRFTLFHEVFHILAHCKTTPIFRRIGDSRGVFNEHIADYFSVLLLLPDNWIKSKWKETNDVNLLSNIFGVSESLIYYRLKRNGLI